VRLPAPLFTIPSRPTTISTERGSANATMSPVRSLRFVVRAQADSHERSALLTQLLTFPDQRHRIRATLHLRLEQLRQSSSRNNRRRSSSLRDLYSFPRTEKIDPPSGCSTSATSPPADAPTAPPSASTLARSKRSVLYSIRPPIPSVLHSCFAAPQVEGQIELRYSRTLPSACTCKPSARGSPRRIWKVSIT